MVSHRAGLRWETLYCSYGNLPKYEYTVLHQVLVKKANNFKYWRVTKIVTRTKLQQKLKKKKIADKVWRKRLPSRGCQKKGARKKMPKKKSAEKVLKKAPNKVSKPAPTKSAQKMHNKRCNSRSPHPSRFLANNYFVSLEYLIKIP